MPLSCTFHVTPYSASFSVEMVSFMRLDFLSVCQSVCTPLLGLAEHSFGFGVVSNNADVAVT